ncbi:Alpha/Beta hydrolase protein [Ganoderma leucocontextum]|nr:Alpha/Beta hydrolase protein [Ganoderma leucocontextum]
MYEAPARRSAGSAYCKTTFAKQLADIEWWLRHVRARMPGLPVFLMGHSMGGGLALGFAARAAAPSTQESISLLSGIVATSPLLVQASPAPCPVRFIARLVGKAFPMLLVPTPVSSDTLTHDKAANEAAEKDPLCSQTVSLVALDSVLGGCGQVLLQGYKHWPRNLPLLIVHGTADKVTSDAASQEFFFKVEVQDKEFKPFEDAYHELANQTE